MTQTEATSAVLYDVEVEQALIGALLTDQDQIAVAMAIVAPDDFFDPLHQRIVAQIFSMFSSGRPATPLTVAAAMLNDPGVAELPAGRDYFQRIALSAPSMPDVTHHARIVVDFRLRRWARYKLEDALGSIGQNKALADVLSPVVHVFDRAQERAQSDDSQPIGQAAHNLLREAEDAAMRPTPIAIPTGLPLLDEVIGGLLPENLILIGGRPGMGKSILGLHLAKAGARAGCAPHIFSLEMSKRENAARFTTDAAFDLFLRSGKGNVAYNRLLHHKPLSDAQWETIFAARNTLDELEIEINDKSKLTIEQIAGLARARTARLKRPPLVIIDHLQIVRPSERYQGRRVDELSEITSSAKDLAKQMKCPVIMLSQLSREPEKREDKRPIMADFRDSGSIEQDADVILGLYRPNYYARQLIRAAKNQEQKHNAEAMAEKTLHDLEIGILKNRSGEAGTEVNVWINPATSSIRNEDPWAAPSRDTKGLLV